MSSVNPSGEESSAPRRSEAHMRREGALTMWVEGKTAPQIAKALGVSTTTVHSYLHRARKDGDVRAERRNSTAADEDSISLRGEKRWQLLKFCNDALSTSGLVSLHNHNELARRSVNLDSSIEHLDNGLKDASRELYRAEFLQLAAHQRTVTDQYASQPYPVDFGNELGLPFNLNAELPVLWTRHLLLHPARSAVELFVHGEALCHVVEALPDPQEARDALGDTLDAADQVLLGLYCLSLQNARLGSRASAVLGRLSVYAITGFNYRGSSLLSDVLNRAPLGVRTYKVMSRILLDFKLRASRATGGGSATDSTSEQNEAVGLLGEVLVRAHERAMPTEEICSDRGLAIEALSAMPFSEVCGSAEIRGWVCGRMGHAYVGTPTGRRSLRSRVNAACLYLERFAAGDVGNDSGTTEGKLASEYLALTAELNEPSGNLGADHYLSLLIQKASRLEADYEGQDAPVMDFPGFPGESEVDCLEDDPAATSWVRLVNRAISETVAHFSQQNRSSIQIHRLIRRRTIRLLKCAFGDISSIRRKWALGALRHGGLGIVCTTIAAWLLEDTPREFMNRNGESERLETPHFLKIQAAYACGFARTSMTAATLAKQVRQELRYLQSSTVNPEGKQLSLELLSTYFHALGDSGLPSGPNELRTRAILREAARFMITMSDTPKGDVFERSIGSALEKEFVATERAFAYLIVAGIQNSYEEPAVHDESYHRWVTKHQSSNDQIVRETCLLIESKFRAMYEDGSHTGIKRLRNAPDWAGYWSPFSDQS